ncbi:metallophosphoesterase family protein [Flavicella sediminum]|uniref:metallophosphoesterase family protein n=1 Tax=Flavicella sediminum TaxID=2585141 RepID=UPI0011208D29|nr:metallophosphoesterase family protein [Flavicella sediminum]
MDKKIKNLGTQSNKLLLFGGVYSNLQALEALIETAHILNIPAENCICTGDLIGYCAQPEETVQLLKKWGAHSILGNVEIQLNEGQENCGCNFTEGSRCDVFSSQWYPYAQKKLSTNSLAFLRTLPNNLQFKYANKNISVVHGAYDQVSEFIFKSTPWSVKSKNFKASKSDFIIAGHCGLPFSETHKDKTWLNPGAIGMPANDGSPKVWYATLEIKEKKIQISQHNLDYNYKLAIALMKEAQLPLTYANTLQTGIWDNMEILPAAEKLLQGKTIKF